MAAFQIVIGFSECRIRPLRVSITISSPGPTGLFRPLRQAGNPRYRLQRRSDELIFGDDVARRTQTVTVEVQAAKRPSDITMPAGPSHGSYAWS